MYVLLKFGEVLSGCVMLVGVVRRGGEKRGGLVWLVRLGVVSVMVGRL